MMSDSEIDSTAEMMSEQHTMLAALHEIAMQSEEAETVRIAMSALTGTGSGLRYLHLHPIIL